MNIKRLELMVTMLTEVVLDKWTPDQKAMVVFTGNSSNKPSFNLSYWGQDDCGYSACACGHAGLDPRFIEQGLTMRNNTIYYKDFRDWRAVEEFFGVNSAVAELLFMKNSGKDIGYFTQSHVIRRILLLLEVGEKKFIKQLGY